ncbi:MAG: HEAT repeat domain-containing protein [Gammaproteobacteria bacterium]|nr:HEAT repeat domain-containing protein [Gammaproteobacteria bacterium]
MDTQHPVADAELLIAPGCPHCPAVLSALADMVKQGLIGRLQVVNIAQRPDAASERGVRGVPWIRIGPFELTGAHGGAELRDWAARATDPQAHREFLVRQLESGELDGVIAACRRAPELLPALVGMAADLDTPFAVRIGIGAVIEDLAGDARLLGVADALLALSRNEMAPVRADAAHYLGQLGSEAAGARLREMAHDPDAEVREIAAESLADL